MKVPQLAWALSSIRSFHVTPWCMASIFSEPGLWLPWITPDVLDADTLFAKERRENRPSATYLFVKRAFPLVQDRHHFCHIFVESLLHRGEGRGQPVMSLPSPAMLSHSGPWLLPSLLLVHWYKFPSLLHVALPAFGGCTACPAASRVEALALLPKGTQAEEGTNAHSTS